MNAIQRNANTTEKKYLYEDAFNPRVDTKVFYKFYISLSFSQFFLQFRRIMTGESSVGSSFSVEKGWKCPQFWPPQLKILNRN